MKNRDELNHAPKAGLSSILRKTNPYQLTNFLKLTLLPTGIFVCCQLRLSEQFEVV